MPMLSEHETQAIKTSLERINLGSPRAQSGLTAWPLLGPDLDPLPYSLLDQSMKEGTCDVRETAAEAVNTVMVENKSPHSIFALHGQLLRGAKQNRAINLTTLFPPNSEMEVKVACVERGRWTHGRSFEEASYMQSAAGRSEKLGGVIDNLRTTGRGDANQSEVWAQQASKQRHLDVQSRTVDEIEIQDRSLSSFEHLIDDWPSEEDQVGAILAAGNFWAIEVFDKASTYRSYQPSLLRSLALEARDARRRSINSGTANPRKLIDDIWSAAWLQTLTEGEGQLAVSDASKTSQCALVFRNTCVSISASGALA